MPVAQWIEHLTTDQKVGGSSPSRHAREKQASQGIEALFISLQLYFNSVLGTIWVLKILKATL